MTQEVIAGGLGEGRVASTAGGGTALSTTATFIRLPLGTQTIQLTPRNFSTAVVAKFHTNPWLTILKTTDAMATVPTDYSKAGQDLSAAAAGVVLSSLDTLANGDFVLIGATIPFRGVLVDVNATNSTPSVLAVSYWNGTAWTNITPTDGTDSPAGTTLGVDGNVTWTVPTDWQHAKLSAIYPSAPNFVLRDFSMYWTRWSVSVALDASVTLDRMLAMNRESARYSEILSGQVFEEHIQHGVPNGIGCLEALTDAGTANMIVNAFAIRDGRFVA